MKACLQLQPDVLLQRLPTYYKIESTEWEIYRKQNYTLNTTTTTKRLIYIHFQFNNSIEESDYHQTYLAQMYPPGRGIWWSRVVLHQVRSVWHFQELNWGDRWQSDIPSSDIQSDVPPVELSGGQEQYYMRSSWHLDIWLSFGSGWPQLFPRAFLLSDEKISSLQVVPWCCNMSDWWCKDMPKLVRTEDSPYNISLHCM